MLPFKRGESPKCLQNIEPSKWPLGEACQQETRKLLFATSGDRCAFCDGLMKITSKATIEHFRPKNSFPALKAEWSNLFPCCDECQSAKGQKFDQLLLKPDELSYRFLRFFVCNFLNGEIKPAKDASSEDQARADLTIKIYGLNTRARCNARLRERKNWLNDHLRHTNADDWQYRFFLDFYGDSE
jgi:uncharacterized protein (TIGR02646 family)